MLGRETSAEGRREGLASGVEGRAVGPRSSPAGGRLCGPPNDGRVMASEGRMLGRVCGAGRTAEPVGGVNPGIAGRRVS